MTAILFENAKLFDGVSAEAPDGMSVLVDGNEIKEVSARPIKAQADRIDCRGKTLMPGLIDNHVHIYIESLKLSPPEPPATYRAQYANKFLRHMLSCGFTSVRDVAGGDHGMAMALRDGFLDGPRFFYGGLCLSQTGGHGDLRPMHMGSGCGGECGAMHNALAVIADGVDACIKAVREELRKGAHHIKIMASGGVMSPTDPLDKCQYSDAEIRAIVEECTRHGAYTAAHCHPAEAIRRCAELGVRSIEHGTLIDEPTARIVAERGVYVVPTMATIHALKEDGASYGMPPEAQEKIQVIFQRAMQGLEIMQRNGVKVGFGTDLLGPQHTRQGSEFGIRSEVFTPFEILHSATAVNAEILQMQGRLGTVAPGALADLLLVNGDPLRDIGLLAADGAHLSVIMKDGGFVKRTI